MFWAADDDVDSEVVCYAKKKARRRCYDTDDSEKDFGAVDDIARICTMPCGRRET